MLGFLPLLMLQYLKVSILVIQLLLGRSWQIINYDKLYLLAATDERTGEYFDLHVGGLCSQQVSVQRLKTDAANPKTLVFGKCMRNPYLWSFNCYLKMVLRYFGFFLMFMQNWRCSQIALTMMAKSVKIRGTVEDHDEWPLDRIATWLSCRIWRGPKRSKWSLRPAIWIIELIEAAFLDLLL